MSITGEEKKKKKRCNIYIRVNTPVMDIAKENFIIFGPYLSIVFLIIIKNFFRYLEYIYYMYIMYVFIKYKIGLDLLR